MFSMTMPRAKDARRQLIERANTYRIARSRALSRVAFEAEQRIEQGMRAGGLGKLHKAIKSGSSANRGRFREQSVNPSTGRITRARTAPSALLGAGSVITDSDSAWVTVKGRRDTRARLAAEAYADGANIKARKRGGWLWIPTENAPKRGQPGAGQKRGRKITPATWPSRFPPLRFVKTKKGAVLISKAQIVKSKDPFGKIRLRAPGKRAKPGQVFDVVMFTGVRQAKVRKRYSPRRIARQQMRRFPEHFERELDPALTTARSLEMVTVG
ncbi:MAG: hypothetical protein AAGA36_00200 [Pseudomonadota bacterium]